VHFLSSRTWPRRLLTLAPLLLLALAVAGFARAGVFLAREDALQKSDAIMVLAGSLVERPLEGADLYLEGWAPRIVLTYGIQDPAITVLEQRGGRIIRGEDQVREALVSTGIPASAFIVPPRIHDNTADEARSVAALARQHGWRRVIVVTSKYHLRRAGFAFRRELDAAGVEVIMHGSRYDAANPPRWWATRSDIRWMLSEVPKYAAYLLGLGA
jgi:uncharacterized SAM-binding protein YcdF (DUF218 family)